MIDNKFSLPLLPEKTSLTRQWNRKSINHPKHPKREKKRKNEKEEKKTKPCQNHTTPLLVIEDLDLPPFVDACATSPRRRKESARGRKIEGIEFAQSRGSSGAAVVAESDEFLAACTRIYQAGGELLVQDHNRSRGTDTRARARVNRSGSPKQDSLKRSSRIHHPEKERGKEKAPLDLPLVDRRP